MLRIVLTVFLPFASGYYLSYFFRSVNAVIAPDLIDDMGLSASDLGLMTAAYFLTFAAFQIPLGILLDRFGPVKVQAALFATAALGAFVGGGMLAGAVMVVPAIAVGSIYGVKKLFDVVWKDKENSGNEKTSQEKGRKRTWTKKA